MSVARLTGPRHMRCRARGGAAYEIGTIDLTVERHCAPL
jgi:hypothetical protein